MNNTILENSRNLHTTGPNKQRPKIKMNFVLETRHSIGPTKSPTIERLGRETFAWMPFGHDIANKCKINK